MRVASAQQAWESVTFVHFPYEPTTIAALLPERLRPDVHDERAWVGVTPFRLRAAMLPTAPGPRSTHVEVNVRTYVRDADGRDALWFLSLELDQPAIVVTLRSAAGLPYRWSRTWMEEDGEHVRYGVERRRPHRRGALALEVEVGETLPSPPGDLETYLTGRWLAFTERAGTIAAVPVQHEPWPLRRAELTSWHADGFIEGLGLPAPLDEPHVMFSAGVEVKLGFPRR